MLDEYDFSGVPQGWQCPVCKRVYSPTYPWCIFCGNEQTVTTTTLNINNFEKDIEHDPDWWKKWRPPYEFTCKEKGEK